jgi:type II secretory pathway pseudopilin PulG
MAKINKNKGLTLVELLLYMSIFSILFLTITSSVFYLQKIIQNNNQNYYVKNQIYTNLNILQQYMYKNLVTVEGQEIKIFTKTGDLILTQKIEKYQLKNIYTNSEFFINDKIFFTNYNISQIEKNRLLKFEISWLDSRGKSQNFTEYIVVINQNL